MKQLLAQLPEMRLRLNIESGSVPGREIAAQHLRLSQEIFVANLLSSSRYDDPKKLNRHEGQVFSQHGEDGIIAEIFSRIGVTSKTFVEIGAGDGSENNSAYLLLKGWSGYWFDCDNRNVMSIRDFCAQSIEDRRLSASRELFTAENAAHVLERHGVPKEFDLLSIDVDRNTSWIWRGLDRFSPRVCIIEYNASIFPQDDWEIPYDEEATWDGSLLFGAGLLALEKIGRDLGYSLVACDISGTNAFFVRSDLTANHFSNPFVAPHHYEPPRYFLGRTWGHRKPSRLVLPSVSFDQLRITEAG